MELKVELPLKTKSALNVRGHWGARAGRSKRERATTRLALEDRPPPPLPVVVTLTRVAPRQLDGDNLQGSLKAIRDEVARWLGSGDSPKDEILWRYEQRRGEPKAYAVEVHIAW